MKGLAFKILSPKDIAGVLTMIGVHPAVSADGVDRPTGDIAMAALQHLAEFAYDMDAQQVKAQVPGLIQYPEIYDEAMDVLTIFKLSRQLSMINRLDDFSFKDIWEPNAKRFRAVVSGMINFCRYKEAKVIVLNSMKEDAQALDVARLELVERSNQLDQELAAMQERHNAELHEVWAAEGEAQEAQIVVDRLQRQRQTGDRVIDEAERKLSASKERVAQHEREAELAREQAQGLQEQIAESPEGLEQEIRELQLGVRQQKAWLEEKSDERRARVLRDQVLCRLTRHLECYGQELAKVERASDAAAAARGRTDGARDELGCTRRLLELRRAEEAELEQGVRQVTAELERAKQAHEERMQQLEARRQQALLQHQELQAKRTEEQKQHHLLQTQRLELEAEVASARRAHEAELNDLRAQQKLTADCSEGYAQTVEAMLAQYLGEAALCGYAPLSRAAGSPDVALRRRRQPGSPSPARGADRWMASPGRRGPSPVRLADRWLLSPGR